MRANVIFKEKKCAIYDVNIIIFECMLSHFNVFYNIVLKQGDTWSGNNRRILNRGVFSVNRITHISQCVYIVALVATTVDLQFAYKGSLSLLAFLMETKGTVGLC